MNGILVINKEKGMTSFDVIRTIKKKFSIKKIGHAGTLDPLATGVLVVLLGSATKLSNYVMGEKKTYEATVVIGESYDTEDSTGKLIDKKNINTELQVDSTLEKILDLKYQIPPMYSALKVNGKKLYELARKEIEVERKAREVEIFDIKRISEILYCENKVEFKFETTVSKGTYIRTLCVEIGKNLGYPAHMKDLNRVKSGKFKIENSYTLSDIENNKYKILPCIEVFDKDQLFEVDDFMYKKISNGSSIEINDDRQRIVFTYNGNLIGVYKKEKGVYKAERIWN
ncbi:MAG: tRNA pseudouridine(55) synthase TruB [Bacilli bacterium]|nr:tRNA pseudouridine(55) synthase TruB [Bacilli bacterium]